MRKYREEKLAPTGVTPYFPLWGTSTRKLADSMVESGLRAYLTAVDLRALDRSFAGRSFDRSLLDALPQSVDPCGENGEFHTFAYAGPMFSEPLSVAPFEVVERDGFAFCDVRESPSLSRLERSSADGRPPTETPEAPEACYSTPRCQGPVMANVMPGTWILTKSQRPQGLKEGPAHSSNRKSPSIPFRSPSRMMLFRANSKS